MLGVWQGMLHHRNCKGIHMRNEVLELLDRRGKIENETNPKEEEKERKKVVATGLLTCTDCNYHSVVLSTSFTSVQPVMVPFY